MHPVVWDVVSYQTLNFPDTGYFLRLSIGTTDIEDHLVGYDESLHGPWLRGLCLDR